jgi:hypothetical protein
MYISAKTPMRAGIEMLSIVVRILFIIASHFAFRRLANVSFGVNIFVIVTWLFF